MSDWLDYFWGEILSRDTNRIQTAFEMVTEEKERTTLIKHLYAMTTESGWADPQRISAQSALDSIRLLIDVESYLD